MNKLIVREGPPACRDDGEDQFKRAEPSAPVAICAGLRHRLEVGSTVHAIADPRRDAALDTKRGSAMPASARDLHRPLPETDPRQPSRGEAFASDPSLVAPVIASPEEIVLARKLRQQLKKRYLNQPSPPCCLWCVGID